MADVTRSELLSKLLTSVPIAWLGVVLPSDISLPLTEKFQPSLPTSVLPSPLASIRFPRRLLLLTLPVLPLPRMSLLLLVCVLALPKMSLLLPKFQLPLPEVVLSLPKLQLPLPLVLPPSL